MEGLAGYEDRVCQPCACASARCVQLEEEFLQFATYPLANDEQAYIPFDTRNRVEAQRPV
jgi:hypothetical protein